MGDCSALLPSAKCLSNLELTFGCIAAGPQAKSCLKQPICPPESNDILMHQHNIVHQSDRERRKCMLEECEPDRLQLYCQSDYVRSFTAKVSHSSRCSFLASTKFFMITENCGTKSPHLVSGQDTMICQTEHATACHSLARSYKDI